jgi:mRNA interferase MazF
MTRSTTTYSCGDVVFVEFQFTDRPVAKNRPALVISSDAYHASRREVIIAAVTSRVRNPLLTGDHLIDQWQQCGLAKPSVATGIIRTVKATMIGRTLGVMPEEDLRAYQRVLSQALGL